MAMASRPKIAATMNAAPGKCTGALSAVNQAIVPVRSTGATSWPSPMAIAEIPCTSPCVSAVARRDIIAISDGCTGACNATGISSRKAPIVEVVKAYPT